MSNVIMYTRNVCGGCDTVETFLTQNGITPEKRNIEEKQEYMDCDYNNKHCDIIFIKLF